jgi:hypothetical protein
MLRLWRREMQKRPWLAVVTAYVVASQVLLAGIAAADMQIASGFPDAGLIICSEHAPAGVPDGSGKAPGGHALCPLCVFANVAAGGALAAAAPFGPPVFLAFAIARLPDRAQIIRHRTPTGHSPRGPPAGVIAAG